MCQSPHITAKRLLWFTLVAKVAEVLATSATTSGKPPSEASIFPTPITLFSTLYYEAKRFFLKQLLRHQRAGAKQLVIISILILSLINTTYAKTEYGLGGDYYHGEYVPHEIIIQFNATASAPDIAALIAKHHTVAKRNIPKGNCVLVTIPADKSVAEMVAIFKQSALVEYVEPNYYAEGFGIPNDQYFKYQWNLSGNSKGSVNILPAWEISKGRGVIVAILDTGIASEDYAEYRLAPDLAATSFVSGYDYVNQDGHPNDDNGHGTHIAGIIAQNTNNGIGTAGIAYQATLMPIKVLDKYNRGSYANIAAGIYYAIDHGAAVINLSLGGEVPSKTLANALREAYHRGITIVAAAGNSYFFGNPVTYPAAYDEYVVAVGAVRYDGKRAPYSNTGEYIDVVAPGGDTTVDQNHDGVMDGILQQTISGRPSEFSYYLYQGTSMATPHVAGVAALLIATGVNQPQEIKEVLTATARDRGIKGWDKEYGYGVVDAYAALTYKQSSLPDVAITSLQMPSAVKLGELVNINVTLQNLSANMFPATITLKDINARFIIAEKKIYLSATRVVTFIWDTAGVGVGKHQLAAEVEAAGEVHLDNNSKSASIIVEAEKETQKANSTGSQLITSTDFKYIYYNGFKEARVLVHVEDERGQPVFGVCVTLEWQYSGQTYRENKETIPGDSAGGATHPQDTTLASIAIAEFRSNPIPLNYGVSYDVVQVAKADYTYNKA